MRVVETEAVIHVDRGDVEADVASGGNPVRCERPEELPARHLHHRLPCVAAGREGKVEERDPDHEHAEHEQAAPASACATSSRRHGHAWPRRPSLPAPRSWRRRPRAAARGSRRSRRSRSAGCHSEVPSMNARSSHHRSALVRTVISRSSNGAARFGPDVQAVDKNHLQPAAPSARSTNVDRALPISAVSRHAALLRLVVADCLYVSRSRRGSRR